jgi:molecular chaperone Hsp33
MSTRDFMVRAYAPELNVRLACVDATGASEEARRRHDATPLATVALSRAICGALLMGATLKGRERVGLQFKGDGPLREVYADADGEGNVRGYVLNPLAELPLLEGRYDVAGGLGTGILNVTSDLGMRDNYQGIVPLESGEMGYDLANYLLKSAQIPSIVNLAVWLHDGGPVAAAGGFLIQALPGATAETLAELEGNVLGLPPLSRMVRDGLSPEEVLARLMHGHRYETLAVEPVRYRCRCSRERVERTLIALGEAELTDMAATNHGAEVKCEFCGERYLFSELDLLALIHRAQPPH